MYPSVVTSFPPVLSTFEMVAFDVLPVGNGPGSAVWGGVRLCVYVPFTVQVPTTIVKLWCANGAAVSGNVDMGLYLNASGLPTSKIVASGSTAQANASTVQSFDITDTLLTPGTYWVALTLDNTTGTILRANFGATSWARGAPHVEETTGSFGLPTTAAPASPGNRLPVFGVSTVTTI